MTRFSVSTVITPKSRASSSEHLDHAHGDVRALLHVVGDHRAVVHLVDVVAGEHQHVRRAVLADVVEVLEHASAVPRYQCSPTCCCAGITSMNSPNSPRR
jgi:hypothetical protein